MHDIIKYYERPGKDYRNTAKPGQLFIAPVPYMPHDPKVPGLRVDYYDPAKPWNSRYTLERTDLRKFDPSQEEPVRELRLSSEEFVLGIAHKFRPVIVLQSLIGPVSAELPYGDNWCIVAPLYGLKHRVTKVYKFEEDFILAAKAYKYPSVFYLPEDIEHQMEESIVWFERIQGIHVCLLRPIPVQLTSDAMYCLGHWLRYFRGEELDELLADYRKDALAALQP